MMYVLQSVGGQNQLIDPRSSFKRPLLYVSDAIITQVAASGKSRMKIKRGKTRPGQKNVGRDNPLVSLYLSAAFRVQNSVYEEKYTWSVLPFPPMSTK